MLERSGEWFGQKIGEGIWWLIERFINFVIGVIVPAMPEIVTLAIVGFALMWIITANTEKWLSKIIMTFLVGSAAIMILR